MAPREHQRDEALAKIKRHILLNGLQQTSLRQLAAAAGVSDRMLLYYFRDKTDILSSALSSIAGDLSDGLDALIPQGETRTPAEVFDLACQVMFDPSTRPYARLWIEITSMALAGDALFAALSRQIGEGYLSWLTARIEAIPGDTSEGLPAMVLGMIEGLIVLEACVGEGPRKQAQSRFRMGL